MNGIQPQGTPKGNPLDQLRDVHVPTDVDWWPLAWGWWALALLLIVLLIGGFLAWRRHRNNMRPRLQAIAEVQQLEANNEDWAAQMNGVLKRAAKRYFPIPQVAGLYGQRWQRFLMDQVAAGRTREQIKSGLETLQNTLYRPGKADPAHFEECRKACLIWLKKARFQARQPVQTADSALEVSDV